MTNSYSNRKKSTNNIKTTASKIGPTRRTKKRVVSSRKKRRLNLSKHLKFGVLAVVSVVLATFGIIALTLFNYFNAPFTRASDSLYFKNSIWDDSKPFVNVGVVLLDNDGPEARIQKLALFKINDDDDQYMIYDFPTREPFKLISDGKEREVTIEDLYSFSVYNKLDFTSTLRDFSTNYLSVKLDGYVILTQDGYKDIENIFGTVDYNDLAVNFRLKNTFKLPQAIFEFRSKAKTNLSMNDVISTIKFIKNTPSSSNRYYNLTKYELLDLAKWDMLWQGNLGISGVKKEGIKVFVLNASNPKIPGLASWGNRISKNLGTGILGTENSFTDFERNTIIAEDEELVTVKTLREIYPDADFIKTSDLPVTGDYNPEIFRTKVTLVLVTY